MEINPFEQINREKFAQLSRDVLLELLDDPDVRAKIRSVVGAPA